MGEECGIGLKLEEELSLSKHWGYLFKSRDWD